jgi:hypothetical protein
VLAIALVLFLAPPARADFGYAYAEQSITGLQLFTGVTNPTVTGSSSSASAAINGSGTSTNDPLDTKQAYLGAAPPASQNFFSHYSSFDGGTQAGDFTRGDALISSLGNLFRSPGVSATNVAETFISTGGTGIGALGTASGSWTVAGTFTSNAEVLVATFNFANDLWTNITGQGVVQAAYQLVFSIKDQHGHEVDASPSVVNLALSSPPPGPEIVTSGAGSASLSLAGLTPGDTFALTITGTETTAVQLTAVPEPSSICLMGIGLSTAAAARWRRRRVA